MSDERKDVIVNYVAILGNADHPTNRNRGPVQVLIPLQGCDNYFLEDIFNDGLLFKVPQSAVAAVDCPPLPGGAVWQHGPVISTDQRTEVGAKVDFVAILGRAEHPEHGVVPVLIHHEGKSDEDYVLDEIFHGGKLFIGRRLVSAGKGKGKSKITVPTPETSSRGTTKKNSQQGNEMKHDTAAGSEDEPQCDGTLMPLTDFSTTATGIGHKNIKRVLSSDATLHGSNKRVRVPEPVDKVDNSSRALELRN